MSISCRWLVSCALFAGLTAGCATESPGPAQDALSCDATRASVSMCVEHVGPRSQTHRLSILAQCREVDGVLVDRCPTEHLVGVCEQQQDLSRPTALSALVRVHHYLHPDVATPAAEAATAARCQGPGRRWVAPRPGES